MYEIVIVCPVTTNAEQNLLKIFRDLLSTFFVEFNLDQDDHLSAQHWNKTENDHEKCE